MNNLGAFLLVAATLLNLAPAPARADLLPEPAPEEEVSKPLAEAVPAAAAVILYAREVMKLPYPGEDGRPILLAPETKFRVEALNKSGGVWKPGEELKAPEALNAKGEWGLKIRATPLLHNGQPMPAPIRPFDTWLGDFTSVAPKQEIAVTQTPRTRSPLRPLPPFQPGQESEVLAALQAFHDRRCSEVEGGADMRDRFLREWEGFVRARDEFSAAAKEKARDVDIVTRTALHESYTPGWFEREENKKHLTHSRMHDCERAVISMTMVNRVRMCKPGGRTGYYGCKKEFDTANVVTQPSQYNIWFDRYLNRQTLVSCYLRSDLGPAAAYTHANGRAYSTAERSSYEDYRLAYRELLPYVMDLYCYSDRCAANRRPEDILKNKHIPEMIRAEEVELKTALDVVKPIPEENIRGRVPLATPAGQGLVLPKLVSYFHPRHMGGCSTRDWPANKYLRVAYVHCADAREKRFLVKDRVVLIDDKGATVTNPDPKKRYSFRLILNSENSAPGEQICAGAKVDGLFANEPNEVTGCIAKGYFPECVDRATVPGQPGRPLFPGRNLEEKLAAYRDTNSGIKISINLTRPAQVSSIKAAAARWITPEMEARSRAMNQGHQKYHVGLRCVYPAWGLNGTREENFRMPAVGGKCDQTLLPSTDWGESEAGFARPIN